MLRLEKGLKTDNKDVGGRCMRDNVGNLCLSEKERGKIRKDYMARIMKDKNHLDRNVKGCSRRSSSLCM